MAAYKVDVEVQLSEHTKLHVNDLLLGIGIIRDVNVVFDQWRPDLFILTSNQHCADSDQLKCLLGDCDLLKVSVNEVDRQEQALNFELELIVHLDYPIY